MKKNYLLILVLLVVIVLVYVEPAYAGPGGAIAKGFFKTWWGKIILGVLTIVLLPLIIYVRMREWFEVRKNKKVLLELGRKNRDFSWLDMEKQVRNVFERVYKAWGEGDMEKVSEYVSPWYWRNQQLVHLDQWKENNQQNICHLKSVGKINPLYLEISDHSQLESSKIAFVITANIEDYLINKETGQVVEGRKGFGEEEKVWIMEYTEGKWLLDDIREGNLSLAYAKLPNIIPETVSAL